MIARLEVTRGTLTEYPLAEKVCGGWQNGVMFYPDAEVTKVTPLIFRNETPTDDEREDMIAFLLRDHNFEESPWGRTYTDAEIANALRRSEVPEPGAEDWDNRDDEVNGETRGFLSCGRCSWSMSRGLFADLHEHERTHESEPQGEPSDARPWRPEDGDTRCQECGRPNPVWWADSDDWNALMPNEGVLCPTCYHHHWLASSVTEQGENR